MLKYVKAFTRDELDLALVNSDTLVTFLNTRIFLSFLNTLSLKEVSLFVI